MKETYPGPALSLYQGNFHQIYHQIYHEVAAALRREGYTQLLPPLVAAEALVLPGVLTLSGVKENDLPPGPQLPSFQPRSLPEGGVTKEREALQVARTLLCQARRLVDEGKPVVAEARAVLRSANQTIQSSKELAACSKQRVSKHQVRLAQQRRRVREASKSVSEPAVTPWLG